MADEDVANAAGAGAAALGWTGFAFSMASSLYSIYSSQKAAEREAHRREGLMNRLRFISSPENFEKVLASMRPIFRAQMAQPIKAAATSAAATRAGRAGTTGSGIAEAGKAAAASAGEFASSVAAAEAARESIRNQLMGEEIGDRGALGSAQFGLGANLGIAGSLGLMGQGLAGASALFGKKPVTGDPGRAGFNDPFGGPVPGTPEAFIPPVQNTAPAQLPGAFAQPFVDPRFPPPRR